MNKAELLSEANKIGYHYNDEDVTWKELYDLIIEAESK